MKHIFRLVLIIFLFFVTNVANAQVTGNFVPTNFVGTITAVEASESIARTINRETFAIQQNKDNGSIFNYKNDENSSSSSNNPFLLSKNINNNIISHLYSDKYLSESAQVSFSYLLFQIQPNAP